ncbi:protein RdxH [Oceaniovalibus guishaninsula JLT2003]|uniref:Protein RdxH n=1 Tax=Oceaniovalibus guishaninsula JLT2003 TaxID=1231392 RepID=K2I387_9RHOB|nr:FixH family protein [Oceaniovalibus guishaninsula]EKE43355.1 protein RdxH [Oceaniovalibus guishaninsula JLT2003]
MTRTLTGRHVFAMFAGGFGVIIAVNLVLATQAVRTFPGLEVANSYVASQHFDRDRDAQTALGWQVEAHVDRGDVVLDIRDAAGPVQPDELHAVLGRATSVAEDVEPVFVFDGKVWRAPVVLGPGNWNIRLTATAPDGTPFRQRIVLHHKG